MATQSHTIAARVLTSATRCHLCGERMEAGEAFAWFDKPARRASKHHTIPARFVPRHVNNCVFEQREREQADRDAKQAAFVAKLAALVASGDNAGALAFAQAEISA